MAYGIAPGLNRATLAGHRMWDETEALFAALFAVSTSQHLSIHRAQGALLSLPCAQLHRAFGGQKKKMAHDQQSLGNEELKRNWFLH